MGVSNLRQSSRISNNGEELQRYLNSDQLSVRSLEKRVADNICMDYPYQGQSIYSGTLIYDERSEFGRARDIEIKYEYRTESGLFILQSDVDFPTDEVINEINSTSNNSFHVYRTLSPDRESLWDFISNSERVIEVSFLHSSEGEIDAAEISGESLPDVAMDLPIESATAVYKHDDQQILVRYTGGSIRIDAPSMEASEYIIQLFERDVLRQIDS